MDFKTLGKKLLFPHIAIMILLVPVSVALLVGSMVFIGTESPLAYVSYVIAAYTLTVWCMKIPDTIKLFKTFKEKNKYAKIWRTNTRLRINVSLYASLFANALFGMFQLMLGIYHRTFWFFSIGAYYICLGVVRFFLLSHTRRYAPGKKMENELSRYRACGWVLLLMNLALSVIVFFMIYWNRTFRHHMIVAIAMAAYTFTAISLAIVGAVKYRKYNSPVISASKAISFAAALVSLLTLESTMLTAFGDGTVSAMQHKLMLGITGAVISLLIVMTAIYMIATATKKLKAIKTEVENEKKQ